MLQEFFSYKAHRCIYTAVEDQLLRLFNLVHLIQSLLFMFDELFIYEWSQIF